MTTASTLLPRTREVQPLAAFKPGLPVRMLDTGVVTRVAGNYGAKFHPPIALRTGAMRGPDELDLLADERDAYVTIRVGVTLDEVIEANGMDGFNDIALERAGDELGADISYTVVGHGPNNEILVDVTFQPHGADETDEAGDESEDDGDD